MRFLQLLRQIDAGRDLDDFLVTALDGAVAFPEMHQIPVRVAEDLHLDVFRARDVPFEKDVRPPERGTSLALRLCELGFKFVGTVHDAHAASAAAKARLDHQRVADACGLCDDFRRIGQRVVGARNGWNARRLREAFRRGLVAECVEVIGRGPDEREAGVLACACKRRRSPREIRSQDESHRRPAPSPRR